MTRLRVFVSRLLEPLLRRKRDRELSEEIESHLALLTEEHLARGLSPEAARAASIRDFGGIEQVKDAHRDQRRLPFADTFHQDFRFAVRLLIKDRSLTAVAAAALALGIGASNTVFTFVNATRLRGLPVDEPEGVLAIHPMDTSGRPGGLSYAELETLRTEATTLEGIAGYQNSASTVTDEGLAPEQIRSLYVSANAFRLLRVPPSIGRDFLAEDDRPGAPPVVILGGSVFQSRYGADRGILGRTIRVNGIETTVIGVMPEGFQFDYFADLWQPLAAIPGLTTDKRDAPQLRAFGRLAGGAGLAEARSELEGIDERRKHGRPESERDTRLTAAPFTGTISGDLMMPALLGSVGFLLLIACANVANLLLARAVGRKRVTAIQAALGASRYRLVRQGLTEGLVLAVLGGAVGSLLAFWGLKLLENVLPPDVPRLDRIGVDLEVLAFTLAISLATGLLFASVPAWFLSRAKPADPLRAGGRDTGGRGAAGKGLLVSEVALATMLLIGASLLIRTVYALTQVDPGFRTDHLLTMKIGVPYSRYEGDSRQALLRQIDERMEALPGVGSATLGLVLPMKGSWWDSIFIVSDLPVPPRAELPSSLFTPVEPGYFQTLSIPLIRGRLFESTDSAASARVVVVNETLARHFWPGEDPIGKRLKQGWPESEGELSPWREIVGVVSDVKQFGLGEETRMQTYIPLAQNDLWDVQLALRTETDPLSLVEPAKRALLELDASLPVYEVETMEALIRSSIAPQRFAMLLLGIFAALALILSAVGLYGVIAYSVVRRTPEIGLRMSVGAARSDIFRLVVRQGMGWALLGALIGLAGAATLSRLLGSFLYGVTELDPLSFTVVPLVLLVVSFAASAAPALGASRIDPIRALRYD